MVFIVIEINHFHQTKTVSGTILTLDWNNPWRPCPWPTLSSFERYYYVTNNESEWETNIRAICRLLLKKQVTIHIPYNIFFFFLAWKKIFWMPQLIQQHYIGHCSHNSKDIKLLLLIDIINGSKTLWNKNVRSSLIKLDLYSASEPWNLKGCRQILKIKKKRPNQVKLAIQN